MSIVAADGSQASSGSSRLVVARIGRAHGLRGEVTVRLHTDVPEQRFVPGVCLYTSGPNAPHDRLTLRSSRDHNGVLLLGFEEVPDRTAAEALRGVRLEMDVSTEDEPEDDAWFDHELVGLTVQDPAGTELGRVIAVEHLPAQDLLEVKRPDGERRLVPLVSAIVPVVDVAAGHIVVDAPPGLLTDLED